ncbi:hypothetical protein Tco_0970355 [Tanacetum coccineum]
MGIKVLSDDVKVLSLWQVLIERGIMCPQPPGFLDPVSNLRKSTKWLKLCWVTSSSQSMDKYVVEILKKFDFASVKTANTPIETQKPFIQRREKPVMFQVTPKTSHLSAVKRIFSKSEQEIHNRSCPISWQETPLLGNAKSKPMWPTSTTEARICRAMQAAVGQNPVYHSKTKHIAIRHHFIRDAYEKKLIQQFGNLMFALPLRVAVFKSKKIAQVVCAWIQSKNSLVKHFEDMRLCRPSKEYLPVWFDPKTPQKRRTSHVMFDNKGECETMERIVEV